MKQSKHPSVSLFGAGMAMAAASGAALRGYSRGNGYRGKILDFVPASINRHTGEPHEHKREIARNLRK